MKNTNRNLRCSTCNSTSNEDIASDPSEYKPHLNFNIDPRDETRVICDECADVVMSYNADFNDPVTAYGYEDYEGEEND